LDGAGKGPNKRDVKLSIRWVSVTLRPRLSKAMPHLPVTCLMSASQQYTGDFNAHALICSGIYSLVLAGNFLLEPHPRIPPIATCVHCTALMHANIKPRELPMLYLALLLTVNLPGTG
jgi:hypothetical protein